jgi:hypothetical protein
MVVVRYMGIWLKVERGRGDVLRVVLFLGTVR